MIEKKFAFTSEKKVEKAILVGVSLKSQPEWLTLEYLDELEFLAETSGVETAAKITQRLEHPDRSTFVGRGKLEEVKQALDMFGADMVIFDDDLSANQARNIETFLETKVLDRSLLILNIFSLRAQSAQAKLQVELAQYQYLYPRLTRMWTHLSRQRGGAGMRGPGEKELETDRRIVKDRIAFLKEKLRAIDVQARTRRQGRERTVRVALVGYTNVGKSTLMNALSKSDILAENKLFATVDATVRKVSLAGLPFLLTDTVGFIRKLPTHLIESFKSTLDEVREADILLHVIDTAHIHFDQQIEVVEGILKEMGAGDKPTIYVFNKIDQFKTDINPNPENWDMTGGAIDSLEAHLNNLEGIKAAYQQKHPDATVFISATERQSFDTLREMMYQHVLAAHLLIFPNYTAEAQAALQLHRLNDEEEL